MIIVYIALILILVYALVYCVYSINTKIFPSYFVSSDDATYPYFAQQVVAGTFHESQFIYSLRIAQIYPIAFFYSLFGVTPLSTDAWNVLTFLGIIIVIFYICKALYNEYAGLIASLLLAVFPLVAILAYTVNPDIPLTFVISLIILLLIYAKQKRSARLGFVTGILLVVAPLITVIGTIMIFLVVAYLVLDLLFSKRKIQIRYVEYMLCGFLLAGFLIIIFNYASSGDPFITITPVNTYYSLTSCLSNSTAPAPNYTLYNKFGIPYNCVAIFNPGRDPLYYLATIFPYNFASIGTLFNQYSHAGAFFYAVIIALIYLVLKKDYRAAILMFFFLAGLLYLIIGPVHIGLLPLTYVLMIDDWRYLSLVSVPMVGIISIALTKFALEGSKKHKNMRILLVCLIIAFLIITSALIDQYVIYLS